MRVRITIDIDANESQRLISYAAKRGFLRENPRKSWSEKEKKEACRYAIQRIVDSEISRWNP